MPHRPTTRAVLALASVVVLSSGCDARPVAFGQRRCITWKDDVGPKIADRCVGCHGGVAPAGGYDTTTYLGVLGVGADTIPDAIAGDADSLLLRTIDPRFADANHQGMGDLLPLFSQWVVDCSLAYFDSSVHAGGILNPGGPDFHGTLVQDLGWDFGRCAKCHGEDFSGGAAGVSCNGCHTDTGGPTACTTCHAHPPQTGAHAAHEAGVLLGKQLDCTECHLTPSRYTDPAHLFLADGTVDPFPADLTFGAFASGALDPAERLGPPTFDHASGTCANVYCHGDALGDALAQLPRPTWNGPAGQIVCGSCHGLGPEGHGSGNTNCATCHPRVASNDGQILSTVLHLDGQLSLGDESGTCSACHGGAANAAPPRALDGATLTTARGVGAHQSHLQGTHRLSAPLACSACHVVPDAPGDPGHVDSALPAEITFGGVAVSLGATPSWNPGAATCAGTHCHGDATPVWTQVGADQATCGTCHAIPPAIAPHAPGMALTACVACHANTVDPFGNILVTGVPGTPTSAHINGVVDVTP